MTKISLLPEMLRADVVAGDLLPIVDVSAGATDRIKIGEIFALLPGRNRIINAQGRINQRGYVSGTATVAANQYTLDRWRVVTSGQNLTWTGNAARNVMTAPAGGVEQVVEGLNIEGGTYTINWTGTAACTVAGVARAKGEVFTLTAATNTTVRFTGGTFTDVQLEPGVMPTAFERAYHSDELARCERYFQLVRVHIQSPVAGLMLVPWYTKGSMRITPILAINSAGGQNLASGITDIISDNNGGYFQFTATATAGYVINRIYALDAEFT